MPRHSRINRKADFQAITRLPGSRTGCVVAHTKPNSLAHARVGLVVSKQIGNSVRRHRVARILREGVRDWVQSADSVDLVIRVVPNERCRNDQDLRADLGRSLRKIAG